MTSRFLNELDVYTEDDLAELFGKTLSSIKAWRRKGKIRPTGYTPGGRPVYSREYVREIHNRPVSS